MAAKHTTPRVVVLVGPNGAGKSTAAPRLLRDTLGADEFVNADVIAQGISGFNATAAALAAGRIMLERLKERAHALKREAYAIYLAARDPRTPWYAKALIFFVVAHTFSPIDLIPDFIPILGYLDDLIITPGGIWLAVYVWQLKRRPLLPPNDPRLAPALELAHGGHHG